MRLGNLSVVMLIPIAKVWRYIFSLSKFIDDLLFEKVMKFFDRPVVIQNHKRSFAWSIQIDWLISNRDQKSCGLNFCGKDADS